MNENVFRDELEKLQSQVEDLEKQLTLISDSNTGGSGTPSEPGGETTEEPWTVLFDKESEDAALNWGLANGITGSYGKLENLPDLSEYNTIRFRLYAVGCHQYYTFDISGQGLNYCRWSVPNLIGTTYIACSIEVRSEETKYLHVNSFKSVTFTSNKYPTITDLKTNNNYYISKIEVKKSKI